MALRCPSCGEAIPFSAEACPSCGADTRVVVLTGDGEHATPGNQGRRWLRASVGLAGVAAVGGLLWFLGSRTDRPPETLILTGPSASLAEESGMRPLQVGQNRWLCPLGWPEAAFDQERRSFPLNHPQHPPPSVMPAACYRSSAEAAAAGFVPAPPPIGAVVVDGIYLVDRFQSGTGDELVSDCAAAERTLGFPIPCPLRLPNSSPEGPFPECATNVEAASERSCVLDRAFVFEYGGFAVPPGFHVLNPDNPGHIVVAAFITDDPRLDPDVGDHLECPGAVRKGTLDVELRDVDGTMSRPSPVDVLACLDGFPPLDRHTILRWERFGATYQVAVLGFTDTSRNLAAAVAQSVQLLGA